MNNNFNPLSAEELTSRINKIPRVNLAQLPTVLEFAPNISKELGINLYIKRDDCTALAFGGNKTRHLEFIMAKTLSGDYDCILTGAASQSNFCRQAVAAAKVGGIGGNLKYPAEFIYDNLMIQTNIIDAAYRNGVKKLLFLGSSCIYPKNPKIPITEDQLLTSELEPSNDAYAIAKIAGIKMCQAYNKQYQTNFISYLRNIEIIAWTSLIFAIF